MAEDKVTNLYNAFVKNGYAMEPEAQFRENLKDPKKRKAAYDALVADGYNMEPFADFESNIGFGAPTPAPAPTAPTPQQQAQPAATAAPTSVPASATAEEQEQAPVQSQPEQAAWQPSEQEKIRMSYQMHTMLNDFKQKSKARIEQVQRMTEPLTPEGRKKLKAAKFQAQLAGTPTKVMGLTPPTPAPATEGAEVAAEGEAQQQPVQSGQSPVPYGVKYIDGKAVTQWLLPDGRLTTNYLEADQAEYGARTARLRHQFENRMKQNGLDPAKPEDVEMQAQFDAQAPAYSVVADLWREAEEKHKADKERNANKHWNSYASMGGGREMRVVTTSMNRHADNISHMTRFDLETMMDNAWNRVGSQITANCYNRLRQQYPGASEEELQATASQMARSLSDNAVYQYAVQQNTPKSTLEYFGRTVADMNVVNSISKGLARSQAGTSGDLAAYEAAMGEYGKNHRVAQVAGTVAGMAVDPVTWVSGGVGSVAGKGAISLGGRYVASRAATSMSTQVGSRLFSSSLTGRIITGAAAGGGNFATYEMLKEGESQFLHGGHVNAETGEVEGYSAGAILKAGGHGLVLGSVTGTLSPMIGNVADKYAKATTSTAGKAGVRFGEVAVSTVAEGTVFSIPQWISGEGDAFDVWTDNMAMMLGFKAQHGIKSAPRMIASLRPFKPTNGRPLTQAERNHNRMDFEERLRRNLDASPGDLSFTADEREELRRTGYGELADLFSRDRVQEAQNPNINPAEGAIELRAERVEAETIHRSPEFDGYSAMEELMQDGRVSQAARAKAYYILTGRMLPMGSVTGYTKTTADDGRVTINSTTADGEIVTSRTFKNEQEAKQETDNIMRQAELNTIDVGERYKEAVADDMVLDAAISEVSPGADPATIKKIYRAVKAGNKDVTESQVQLVEFLDDAIGRNKEIADKYRPEAIRAELMNSTGIDVDAVLRKMPGKRTEAEQAAVKSYLERLFPEEARQQNADPTPEQAEAQNRYEQGRLLYGRFEEGDPTVQADVDAIALRMQEAYQAVEDAFGAEAEYYMFHVNENPWALVNDPELTAEQQDAVLYYINAKAALDGVMDASNEVADRKRAEVEQSVGKRTHKDKDGKDDGMIISAETKMGKQVYIVMGDVVMFPDNKGVDRQNSSSQIWVLNPESGEYEPSAPEFIERVIETVSVQDELDTALSVIEQEQMNIFGENAVAPEEATESEAEPEYIDPFARSAEAEAPATTDTEEYDRGYEEGIEVSTSLSDEVLNQTITDLRGRDFLTEEWRGRLEAYEYEQQRRQMEAQNAPAETTGNNGTENIPAPEQQAETALSRIPLDEETQEPRFTAVDPETAWDGLVEAMEGEANALPIAQQMIEDANKRLEALGKKPPTPVKPKLAGKAGPMAMRAEQKRVDEANAKAQSEYQQALADAQAEAQAWSNILRVYTSRNAELRRQQEEERRQRDAIAHDEAVARFEEEQRIKAEKQAEQERIGVHAVNPKIRERWESAPKVEGNEDALTLPDGSTISGRYILTEAGAASPSHDVNNAYAPTEGFPIDENGQSVNDRDYQRDKDAQQKVEGMAGNYDNRALQDPVIVSKDGSFDEHKVMYGFPTEQAARDAYLSNYEQGWTGLGAITHVSKEEFKKWIGSSKRKTKPFANYKSVKPKEDNSMVGRSLSEQEVTDLIAKMEANAEVAPAIELTPENWIAQFGEDGTVKTPIGIVKMGDNQLLKLYSLKRTEYFGMIHPTLNSPDVILEEADPKEGSERDSKYLFIKTFVKSDGTRIVHFESVTVKKDGMEVSISSHEIKDKSLKNKMQNDIVLHLDEKLSPSSEMRLTETPSESEGPDLVPTSDNVSSDGKDNTLSADKQTDGAESSEPYTITPTTYTNKKGKTSDVHLVKFNRELTKEEKSALDTFVREPLAEGKKTSRGWYDRKQGGYMMRSEEAARQLGEMLGNEEAVAYVQPMTAEELREAVGASRTRNPKPKKSPINRVSLEDVMTDLSTKGETKLSDHAEPVKAEQEAQHEISDDEMQWLANELRELLGIGEDEGDADIKFRDPGELTPQERQRIQSAGIRLAMGLVERGTTSFPDYATKMVGLLGDKIRPWLKSFYEGARWTPGYEKYAFTPTEQVAVFDVQNFDKKQADPIAQAAMIVEERKAATASEQAQKELIETRNKNRRENDKQREADTAALAEKAEAVAGEAESIAETSADAGELNRASELIDQTLDEVNDQLAVLGYYEAVEDDSKFHESYGYMLTAEKKAVADATKLAKQLVNDLGIDIKVTSATTPLGRKSVKKGTAVRANIAPAGGDVIVNLPLNKGRILAIYIGLEPVAEKGSRRQGDNLAVERILYRVENPNGKGMERYGHNMYAPVESTYADFLRRVKEITRDYLPKEKSVDELWQEWSDMAERGESPYTITPEVEAQLAEERKVDVTHNGYKVGDEVMWDRYGNGNWEKVKIEDFDTDGGPIFEAVKGVMSEKGDWNRVKPADGIFGEAKRVARAAQEKKKSAPAKKKTAVKPEQPVAELFGGLFDEPINDEKKTDVQPRPGTAERERGHEPQSHESLGESQRNEVKGTDGRGMGGRDSVNPMSDGERGTGVPRKPKSKPVAEPLAESDRRNVRNNHAERGTDYAPKGEDARIKANIEAIELAKRLLDTGESATPEQMAVLRRFSGWGGLGKAFNESDNVPNPTAKRLRELLGEDGYNDAVMSRNSAYFTPAPVIDAMWIVAKAMGFTGGNVLEGSAGIGNILGLMPVDLSDRSSIHAVEIDRTTGGILSLLYPDAKVDIQGFEKTRISNNSIDLAITNVPFVTGLRVMDETGDKDLSKKFRDIHDFCIAKNIRKLREGGIGIFITSSGTMDNSKELRRWIINEGNADVVGAFRMHNKTFGGTGATSDIIVVRKRVNGKPSPNAIDVTDVAGVRVADYDTGERRKVKGQEIPVVNRLTMDYNKYFAEHPENMAGEMRFGFEEGDTFRPKSKALYPVRGKEQSEMLTEWAGRFADMEEEAAATPNVEDEVTRINEQLGEGVKEGSMVLNSQGELCMARMGEAVPLGLNKNKVKGHTKAECFNAYTAIKKALSNVLEYQSNHESDEGLAPLLKELNRAFDTFTRTYGNLHKNTAISFLRNDVDFSSILALETYSEKGDKRGNKVVKVGKTDIFSRRVIETEKEPQPTTIKDGILASLYKSGGIDVEYIGQALGKSTEDVKREIVESGLGFENPSTGAMEVSYQYLSGNVREKLHIAQENNDGGRYDANIKALENVMPMTIPAHLIEFALGSSWIEPKLYEDFVYEKTGIRVTLTNAGGTWFMKTPWNTFNEKNRAMAVVSKMCDKTIMGHELIESAITNKQITVSKTVRHYDGTTETITDKVATAECGTKVDEIRAEFKDWAREHMQADPEMSARIERTYNEQFNNYVPMSIPDEFVPQHFGGQVSELHGQPFALRPHQGRAVVRGTTEPILLAHEVGTGKTYTLITTAMEMRRLGTARKPMIVVQNATVGQFVESAKEIYPNAKVLTIEEADRTAEGRRNFYAKIKYNDWDMIVVPQSVFERIPDSPEREMAYVKDIIDEKMKVLEAMREADSDGRSMIVRQAERELAEQEERLAELTEAMQGRKKKRDEKKEATTRQNAEVKALEMLDREVDDVENFDDMGIDAILVDEAHEYKHLGFATAMQRGVKGVDPSFSKKSQGVFLKAQAVMERNNGRNVVFATGTPISNTAAEIWTFMRYLMPIDTMKSYGIYYFDDFVRNFGNIAQMVEFATNGKFKENNRFAGYVNLPELVRIWSSVADTVLTREAGGVSDKIPDMEGGKPQDIYLPQTRALRSVMKFVKAQLDRYDNMTGKEKKENSHIPLTMYGIAKAAAVDVRLVVPNAEDDPNSKTNATVRETLRSLKDSDKYKGTVAIFSDNYQNNQSGFNLYEDIRTKLIAEGVPADQIVVIKSGMTVKKKLDIFEKVNAGEIRVIMGSTFTLGTGVNIQERLHTLIHVDAPNRPMDYTQRNGRALRQGNLHKDMGIPVRIIRFGVEDSLDVTAYQRLKTKGAIADSIMNGSKMMQNSMENRVLEEEEDSLGDMTAQLSGSEYAILKNQAEREVRSLTAKQKGHDIDQIYVHNQLPKVEGFIKGAERRIELETKNLEIIGKHFPDGSIKKITIGKLTFDSVGAMEDFFKEQNAKMNEAAEAIREGADNYTSRLTVDVDGLQFEITTTVGRAVDKNGQGTLIFEPERNVTYSCEALGIKDEAVKGNRIKNVMQRIAEDIATGNSSRELLNRGQQQLAHYSEEYRLLQERNGREFPYKAQLAEAKERLAKYEEAMRKELEEKEAKYAEMDKSVDAASDIALTDEDSEDTPTNGDGNKYREDDDIDYSTLSDSNPMAMEARISELSKKVHTPVRIIRSLEELNEITSHRKRNAKGWWSAKDNEVVIVLPNNVNVADVDNTFVHEVAGHKGLRAFIGEERFDEFLGEVYNHASNPIRKVIDKKTDDMVNAEADRLRVRKAQARERAGEDVNSSYYADMAEVRVEAEKKREDFRKEATEEYMSDLGGRIGSEGFEKISRDELTLWGKIKAKVQSFLDKFLRGLKIAKSIRLNDKDLSYILFKSWKNMREKQGKDGVFADAEDAVMRRRTGYDADEVTRFRDPGLGLEETITKMKADALQANTDNLQAKRDAMRAIGGNLNHLRQAMARQREYDITTVKSVADLARVLMDANLLDDLSKYETKRILGAINNVVGKQDVSQYVQKVMDIMVDNQLRMGANTLGRLLSIRGSHVDARGIEVQGELDPDGQRIAQVVRKATSLPKDDIDNRIAEAINRMSSSDQAIADEATLEYAGLQIARQYVEDITESKAEEKALRDSIKQAKEDKDAGQMTESAYRQYVASTEDAIRQNKIERAEAFHSLVEQVGSALGESVERAKAWREAEKQRVEEIHHNANSDMEGRPIDEHHKDDRTQKLANNSGVRFLLAPLATFDQMLRMFGKKNTRGEGYLWNRYMRGWVSATEKEYTGYRDALKVLDAKVSEIYGKDMKWGDLFSIDRKLPKASVRFFDGGEMKDHELTQGNLLYIYMADKMSDGRMKLRRMGITEEDIEDIKNFLDPKFIQLADWMQEEFLVDKRNEYNEVHKRMFGASMAAIENYFPLKILANARLENVDVADDTTDTALPATSTGSIIKRRRNNLALDVTGANAFSVILDHLQQMERWAAFAEFNRDLNTLLSYKRFRNQVMNMSSVYGGGKTLWNNFRNVCSMAAGAYRPPIAALDKAAVNIAKGVTAAKVSFRVFTALKQFLSMPAYISDSNPMYLAANIANPIGAWRWSMKNLPLFEKRWSSRMAGDPRLLKSDMDWKMWRSRIVEIASRVGMSPNAFVDALTVAIGSHSMYQTKLAKYKRQGYDPDVAEARAKQDATILFNQTQQSSEGAFLSTMQVDRSWLSVLFTVFRNSSMSYTRQLYDSIRNLGRRFTPGYKGLSEEFMAKQMRRDGIVPDKADRNAKQEYRRGIIRDLVRVGVFGYVLQLAWNLGAYLPYLILGEDEEEKDKMWQDVWNHTMFGSIEGLTGGDVMSAAGNMWVSGEGNPQYLTKDMPLASDVLSILKKMDKDQVSAMNDVINLLVQSTVGVNPQSLTDAVVAVIDYCGDDAETSRECALLIARVLNCPQSQLDKIYFDELDASGEEASQMTPSEIAERYARYKVRRGAPLTGWAYGNEQREKLMDKYRDRSNTLAKERLTRETDKQASQNMAQWLEEFEATKDRVSEIKRVKSRDEDRYYELLDELEITPEYDRYEIIKGYKRDVDALTKEWLKATTPAQRDSCVQAIIGLKSDMVRELMNTQQ